MAVLLEKITWSNEPLFPEVPDPAWEAEVRGVFGVVPTCARMLAPNRWMRRAYLEVSRCPTASLTEAQAVLAGLVTAQENACRYCYGVARAQMRMLGFSEKVVEEVEGRAQLAEANPADRELLQFCRNLARSKPRPSREARKALESVGFSSRQSVELAWSVAAAGFCNRVATLMATPPELGMEAMAARSESMWQKLTSWLPGRGPSLKPQAIEYPPARGDSEFGLLVEILHDTPAASVLEMVLKDAFATSALPRRTRLLMFAVVARTLDCVICEGLSLQLLESDGMSRGAAREVLATLGSGELSHAESLLLPWTRETVWMPEEPKRIQEHTRPLIRALGSDVALDAIGIAALANSCVRLAMLLQ